MWNYNCETFNSTLHWLRPTIFRGNLLCCIREFAPCRENLRNTIAFLRDLRANNNPAWFEQNRKRYDTARGNYADLVTDLIIAFNPFEDLGSVTADDCIYRIYRDVRFSRDKTPYKTNMGAVIGKSGRKTVGRSYYIQIGPEGESFIAAGLYAPSKEELARMRCAIMMNPRNETTS